MSLAAPIEGRAFVIGVAVVSLAAFALTRGGTSDGAVPAELAEGAVVETFVPDRVALESPGAEFRPPWFVGAPDVRAIVTRGEHPRPRGLFVDPRRAEGWARWDVDNQDANDAEPARARTASTYDFLPALRDARVSIVNGDGVERVCADWLFGRWYCGPDSWNYIGPTPVTVRNRETECIWAHPTAEGTIRIAFEDVPVGRLIAGRHMLSDTAAESGIDGGVELVIRIDGQEVARKRQNPRAGASSFRVRMAEEVGRIASGAAPEDDEGAVPDGSGDTEADGSAESVPDAVERVPSVARGQLPSEPEEVDAALDVDEVDVWPALPGASDDEADSESDGSGEDAADDDGAPEYADVVFEVSADEVGLQHFCFAAEVRHIPTGR